MRRATAGEILPFVVSAGLHAARMGCAELPEHIAARGLAFLVLEHDLPVFGYVLEPQGRELVITAAAGRSRTDLTRAVLVLAERQGQGFDAIRFHTVRPGLVRKARRLGYEGEQGGDGTYIMRKAMR